MSSDQPRDLSSHHLKPHHLQPYHLLPDIHRRHWLRAGLAATLLGPLCGAGPIGATAAQAATRPDLLLARDMPPGLDPSAYLVSEKLDGVRAYWDGQRLRFRGGGVVSAPAWFTQRLPPQPLDGELWLARGQFEKLLGAVRREQPVDAEWRQLSYQVFELPAGAGPFEQRAQALQDLARALAWPQLHAVPQQRLASPAALQQRLQAVLRQGGEGLMLHRADAPYLTGRSDVLLKLKPQQDAEATVVAHLPGQGRHAGRLGALQVRGAAGQLFAIGTGFTDAEREAPPPVGSVVTYRHLGLTGRGLPRHPSYLRLYDGL